MQQPGWCHLESDGGTARLLLSDPPPDLDRAGADLAAFVADLLARGTARVETSVPADRAALLACALVAGLRREGALRQPGGPDLLVLGRLAGDVDPAADRLPTIAASMPTTLRAAGWYLSDPNGRVLMVDPVYKPGFDIPGGVAEAGEDLREAATRELREELALTLTPGPLLALDFCPASERRGDIELAIFDGGVHDPGLVDTLIFPDGELAAAHWVHPAELDGQAPAALIRRLRAVHTARRDGRLPGPTVLLRDGR